MCLEESYLPELLGSILACDALEDLSTTWVLIQEG
jgi:hypothetical protein